ncbi:TetR/AcrR family transcriptional regulator [Shewanella surugensis]|uniref:TetR/AcrR family transcriptional regulator n=1 Tax=Shewanella surugensis TaxID=212020 RepID=A0ABT0LJ63_9GAMM|nr:TetR/AcrR family transcriptional regulator [Shewanella surugensis]MCL1127500.1 TetR/AcrR family transcriptional regulator [Shewanella surugensis]
MNTKPSKKDKIIAAARELFTQYGFKTTSLDMIIKKTGGSRRNIYTYFDGRDGLIRAVLESIAEDVLRTFESLPPDDTPAKVWLTVLGETYLKTMTRYDVVGMFRQLIALSDEDHNIGKLAFSKGPEVLAKRVEGYLRYKCVCGNLKIDDARAAAYIFIEMIKGEFVLKALMTHSAALEEDQISEHVGVVVKMFLKGTENVSELRGIAY